MLNNPTADPHQTTPTEITPLFGGSQACSGRDAQGDHYVWRLGQLPGVSGPHRLRRPTEPRRNTPPPGVQIGALSHSLICAIFTNFQVRTLSPSVPVMPEGPKRNAREAA